MARDLGSDIGGTLRSVAAGSLAPVAGPDYLRVCYDRISSFGLVRLAIIL